MHYEIAEPVLESYDSVYSVVHTVIASRNGREYKIEVNQRLHPSENEGVYHAQYYEKEYGESGKSYDYLWVERNDLKYVDGETIESVLSLALSYIKMETKNSNRSFVTKCWNCKELASLRKEKGYATCDTCANDIAWECAACNYLSCDECGCASSIRR